MSRLQIYFGYIFIGINIGLFIGRITEVCQKVFVAAHEDQDFDE